MTTDDRTDSITVRLTPGEKGAIDALVRQRAAETGDDSVAGWFRVVLRREAKAAGVTLDGASLPAAPKTKSATKRRAGK